MPISVSPDWTLCCTKAMGCWSRAACWYLMGDVESLILLLLVVLLLVVPYFLWALADRMKLVRSSLASSLLPPSCDWLVPGDKDVILNKGSMCLSTPHLLSCDPRFLFLFVCHKLEQQHSERMKTFNNVFRSPVNVDCQSVASVLTKDNVATYSQALQFCTGAVVRNSTWKVGTQNIVDNIVGLNSIDC